MNAIIEQNELIDIWRIRNPNKKMFTFRCLKPEQIFTRLDYFLTSIGVNDLVENADIRPGFMSDHSCIKLTVKAIDTKRGPGFWKLNCSLLKNSDYIDHIKKAIKDTCDFNQQCNPNTKWELIKMAVRSSTIDYAARKKS